MTDTLFFGATTALVLMAVVTYLCRISGYVLMGFIPLTPRVRRGLGALPGCIIISVVLPLADRGGLVACLGLGLAALSMMVRRNELLALLIGIGAVVLLRRAGL